MANVNPIENSAKNLILFYSDKVSKLGYNVTEIERKQFCFEFSVNVNKNKIKLLIYFGKKGIKTVLQGNKELKEYSSLNKIIFGEELFGISSYNIDEPSAYIGTDESGKGDYFGPLVIAGAYVDENTVELLKKIGVKDSKELSELSIKKIALEIKNILGNNYEIITITPSKYNFTYNNFGNINNMLGWAHAKVLKTLIERCNAKEAISDKFGDENYILKFLHSEYNSISLHQYTKAERYTAVAAASILARDKFCHWFDEIQKTINLELPKGASERVEKAALNIKSKLGRDKLNELAKLHFKTTNKIY